MKSEATAGQSIKQKVSEKCALANLWTCRPSRSRSRCCRLETHREKGSLWVRVLLHKHVFMSQKGHRGNATWVAEIQIFTRLSGQKMKGNIEKQYLSEMQSQHWTWKASSTSSSHVWCSKWSWSSGPAVDGGRRKFYQELKVLFLLSLSIGSRDVHGQS